MGGVIYDSSKELAFIFFGPCNSIGIEEIELEAMCYVSQKISSKWPGKCAVICLDSSNAVKRFQDLKLNNFSIRSPVLGTIIHAEGLANIWSCKISKLWNREADLLAKHGIKKNRIVEGFF